MFGIWQSHNDYLAFVHERKIHMDSSQRTRLDTTYAPFREKLRLLNLDEVGAFMQTLYSPTGRPAVNQPQIIRSFVLFFLFWAAGMCNGSLTAWVRKTKEDELVATLIGCTTDSPPALGSYYDLIDRLWHAPSSDWYSRSKTFPSNRNKSKPSGRLKKGEKAPESAHGIVKSLAKKLGNGLPLTPNHEKYLQDLFFIAAVIPSIKCGLISTEDLTLSGDGTCIHTHASAYGHTVHPCKFADTCKRGDYCPKHFSDPDADYGWDSDLGQYYYGYTLYHLSYHNCRYAVDLPLLLRYTSAKRHDSVNILFALDEFRRHEPGLHIHNLCLDSAHDNYPTYELLKINNTRAFIDLNKRRKDKAPIGNISFDTDGTPICQEGRRMYYWGYDSSKHAHKWRCPFAVRKEQAPCKCTESSYGRVVCTKLDEDLRLYPDVARSSKQFKEIYNNRTSCERVNKRILHDYHLEDMKIHFRSHYSFMTAIIGICIHLDARYKQLQMRAG